MRKNINDMVARNDPLPGDNHMAVTFLPERNRFPTLAALVGYHNAGCKVLAQPIDLTCAYTQTLALGAMRRNTLSTARVL
jgi:hypothetical protein